MMETLYRPVAAELDIMRAEQGGSDGRTVFGILVPWNHPMRIDENLREQFEPGGADHVITAGERGRAPGGLPAYRMHFAREHVRQGGAPIGRTQLLRDDAAGLYGEWRVSKTPVGDETIELIKDGVYRELSVGFRCAPGWSRRLPDGTVSRTRFDPFEAAVVLRGAYADAAAVAGVRDEDGDTDESGDELANLRTARALLADWPLVAPGALRADNPKKPYGDVTYADPGYQSDHKKRYPIDTADHARAAWSYINQQGNAAKYTADEVKAIKGRIRAALKRFGVEVAA
jgi:Escherichia/Staphylococcus phage prohead protease